MRNKKSSNNLPYLYLVIGSTLIFYAPSYLTSIVGSLFFIASSIAWNNRLVNQAINKNDKYHSALNIIVYNTKPFACLLLAALVATWLEHKVAAAFALLLVIAGLLIIYLRSSSRQFYKKITKL